MELLGIIAGGAVPEIPKHLLDGPCTGCLEVRRKGESHRLGPRDVMYISGETKRSYQSFGTEAASAMIISFDRDPGDPRRMVRKRPV